MLCLSGFELYSRWVPLLNLVRPLSSDRAVAHDARSQREI